MHEKAWLSLIFLSLCRDTKTIGKCRTIFDTFAFAENNGHIEKKNNVDQQSRTKRLKSFKAKTLMF